MSRPFAICIEDLAARPRSTRYLRCVALPGRQPGLRLNKKGQVLWQHDDLPACELWVSADEKLILYRQEGMSPVTLQRAGRCLDVPFCKPVVVVDQDEVLIGKRHLRLHVHGLAATVAAPSPLAIGPSPRSRLAQAATAAAVIGAAIAAGGCDIIQHLDATTTVEVRDFPPAALPPTATPTIEVRDFPPVPLPPTVTPMAMTVSESIQGIWIASQVFEMSGEQAWITGTLTIEGNSYSFEPSRQVSGPSVDGVLDFMFTNPSGAVGIDYGDTGASGGLSAFAPGKVLATCTFLADNQVIGEFMIRLRDTDSLEMALPTGEADLWKVVKTIK